MKLRDYQQDCLDSVMRELQSAKSTLAVMPTGVGKTVVFSHVADQWKDGRVLILVHRDELALQARQKAHAITGSTPCLEKADSRAIVGGIIEPSKVVVASVQTLNSGRICQACNGTNEYCGGACFNCMGGKTRRMERFNPQEFGLIITDEAHHAPANSYRRIYEYFGTNARLKHLGVTATPDRLDEAALGQIYDTVAYEYDLPDAIDDGWLVPIKQEWVILEDVDFSGIRTHCGDLAEGELSKVMSEEKALHGVVGPTLEAAGDKATLIFTAGVSQAERTAEILNRHKAESAIAITGTTPPQERRDLLKAYSRGKYQFLVGCGVFLEGFDEPRIKVVAMARPTASRSLYAQAAGRGTRPILPPMADTPEARRAEIAASEKPDVLVLDFVGNSGKHKLICTADILGGKYEQDVIDAAVEEAKEQGKQVDMRELLEEEAERIEREKKLAEERRLRMLEEAEQSRRNGVKAKVTARMRSVDPFDVFDATPGREPGWHKGRVPSAKQKATLRKFKVEEKVIDNMSFWQASQLLDKLIKRMKDNKCSYKQAKLLKRYGYDVDVSFDRAGELITELADNGWKKPSELVEA